MRTKVRKQGFTLVELLVAFMIFSIGIIALVGIRNDNILRAQNVRYKHLAISLGKSKIEELSVKPLDEFPLSGNFEGYDEFTWNAEIGEEVINIPVPEGKERPKIKKIILKIKYPYNGTEKDETFKEMNFVFYRESAISEKN